MNAGRAGSSRVPAPWSRRENVAAVLLGIVVFAAIGLFVPIPSLAWFLVMAALLVVVGIASIVTGVVVLAQTSRSRRSIAVGLGAVMVPPFFWWGLASGSLLLLHDLRL